MHQFLTNDKLNKLIQGSYWQIEAGGDVFTFSRLEMGRHNRKISPAEITERMGEAKTVFELFRSTTASKYGTV